MKVEVVSKEFNVTQSMQEHIDQLVTEVESYFKLKPNSMRVEIKERNNIFKIEAMLFFKNDQFIRQEVSHEDFYTCINQLANRIKKQVRKLKAKLDDKKHMDNHEIFSQLVEEEKLPKLDIRYKHLDLKPMDLEEAILQLEALGLDYFIYQDVNDKVCVVYKRHNGYGVIDCELA